MSYNIGSYEEKLEDLDWSVAKEDLGIQNAQTWNIGELCSDRICQAGHGDKLAMLWEGHGGKTGCYTRQINRYIIRRFPGA